jgi:hypothetical protein
VTLCWSGAVSDPSSGESVVGPAPKSATVVALRPHVHTHDAPNGTRWRGGIVRAIVDGTALLEVLAEPGLVKTFKGPAAGLQALCPIVVRLMKGAEHRIAEVRGSTFATYDDAWLARDGCPGVFGIVPRSITLELDILWRGTQFDAVVGDSI